MLDPNAITQLVEQQISKTVNDQVLKVFESDEWLVPIEQKILEYTQDRILKKFAHSDSMPEIISAVKNSVEKMFADGNIPGIDQFITQQTIESGITLAIEKLAHLSVSKFENDPVWLNKVESMIGQTVVNRVLTAMSTVDVNSVIRQRVDENLVQLKNQIIEKTTLHGIQNTAQQVELTVLDQHVVVENQFTAKSIEVVDTASIKHLSVTGSVNVDNPSWNILKNDIAQNAIQLLTNEWKKSLITDLKNEISKNGIEFNNVTINGTPLISEGKLSSNITSSNIQELGTLKKLKVTGESQFGETFNVLNRRVGVNTTEPEMALGIWDEEVSLLIGKLKNKTAYVGTGRSQSLSLGVNRDTAVEIDINGLTMIKKLQIGLHRIGHATEVPGWQGTHGDIIFNSSASNDNNVFAWMCIGGYKWKTLRSI